VESGVIVQRRLSLRLRVALAVLALVAVLGGGYIWLRDSSLVAVRRVTIVGVAGADADQIRSALTLAARNMTTLDVHLGQLRTSVAPYSVVKDLRVSTQFPHGMRIRVLEQLPVGALVAGGRAVPVTGDGTLLRDVSAGSLPEVPVRLLPGGSEVTDGATLGALAVLAAAPPRILPRVAQVTRSSDHGFVAQLRSGPSIYFGDDSVLAAKWVAATEVLAAPGSAGASYIDVTDPSRPAAGASPAAVAAAGLATSGSGASTGQSSSFASSTPAASQPASAAATQSGTGSGTPSGTAPSGTAAATSATTSATPPGG
jgi:cell division protein FtsQ